MIKAKLWGGPLDGKIYQLSQPYLVVRVPSFEPMTAMAFLSDGPIEGLELMPKTGRYEIKYKYEDMLYYTWRGWDE